MPCSFVAVSVVMAMFAFGCASSIQGERVQRPAADIDLRQGFPQLTPSPFGEPFGTRVKIREHVAHAPSIDAYLKDDVQVQAKKPAPREVVHVARQERADREPPQPSAVLEETPAAPPPLMASAAATPSTQDAKRYALRENAAEKQREFRGGDAIVIGAGTLVLILLVVLLVLLLR